MPNSQTRYAVLSGEIAALEELKRLGSINDAERRELKKCKKQLRKMTRPAEARDYRSDLPRTKRTEEDRRYTAYLRNKSAQPEFRGAADANALSTAPNSAGVTAGVTGYDAGYMIPQGFWQQLTVALRAYGGIASQFRQVTTPTGNPMPWPTVDPTAIVGSYITEQNQLGFGGDSAGTDYTFGQGMLNAWTIVSGVILASVQLINDSAFDVDGFVADRVGEAIGRKIAAEAVSGTGSSACLGLVTALNARGSTGTVGSTPPNATGGYITLAAAQKVNTFGYYGGSAQTELQSNALSPQSVLAMLQSVDSAYYPNAKFYMHPNHAWNMRGVVDANGRPLLNFMNGLTADDVRGGNYNTNVPIAQLMGFPVICDPNLSGTLTASTTGGPVFGDLSRAMVMRTVRGDASVSVLDSAHPTVLRLQERYADYLQVGYIGYVRCDMRSNDIRAAVTVKCAAT